MNQASDSYTTYRGHAKAKAFDVVRNELLRHILNRLPHDDRGQVSAVEVARLAGLKIDRKDLFELRNGDTEHWSDPRLYVLAERLGVRVSIGFESQPYAADRRVAVVA